MDLVIGLDEVERRTARARYLDRALEGVTRLSPACFSEEHRIQSP